MGPACLTGITNNKRKFSRGSFYFFFVFVAFVVVFVYDLILFFFFYCLLIVFLLALLNITEVIDRKILQYKMIH